MRWNKCIVKKIPQIDTLFRIKTAPYFKEPLVYIVLNYINQKIIFRIVSFC